ncbi:MAG: hypothetical protein EOM19_05475, partial [Candidatus Moranbacteria bacterium]|nr:hypothetical protein [Candidatus Moranbacteria bacterium]
TDTHFSEGTKTDLGILGSGDEASLGLLSALGAVAQVSAGQSHTCALKTDGTVWCWGRNDYGQLGDNTTTDKYTPVQVLGVGGVGYLEGVSQISLGASHSCALKTDGTAWCWGRNNYGQLGDNNTSIDRYTPVQVLGVNASGFLQGVSQVSSGESHTCAIKTDGTVWCWGYNLSGRLGDNTTTSKFTPVQVVGVGNVGFLQEVSRISVGGQHSCVLKNDTTVFCWGFNGAGQLGDNTTTNRYTPIQVLGIGGNGYLEGISQISLGASHTCITKTDGTAYCWGRNNYGQLGNNTVIDQYTPVQVLGVGGSGFFSGVSLISVGGSHACALKTDGTTYCWGFNSSGQLGDNTTTQRLTPVQVLGGGGSGFLSGVSQISVGSYHTCSLTVNNIALCWGSNSGQLGDNTTSGRYTPVKVLGVEIFLGYVSDIQQTVSGSEHSCILKSDHTMWCWGANSYGELGNGAFINKKAPVQVLGVGGNGYLTDIFQIAAGSRYSCAVKTDGTVYCWGRAEYGIGDNTIGTSRNTPVQVLGVGGVGVLSGVIQVSVGSSNMCALKTDGTVWCWGTGQFGGNGDNTTTQRLTPVQVLGVGGVGVLSGISEISTGYSHTCALKTDGTVWCWGSGDRLGSDKVNGNFPTPIQVDDVGIFSESFSNGEQVSSGNEFSCALNGDGTVWCWGRNYYGQIGNDTQGNKPGAVQVKGVGGVGYLTDISQIANGNSHVCALKTDGTAYCWGENGSGRLGDNTTTQRNTPVQVKGVGNIGFLSNISQITAGNSNTCALKTDGTAYCWGTGQYGGNGDNTTTQRYTPVQVKGVDGVGFLENVSQISAGFYHTCATKTDGTAYCWGSSSYGQLGDDTTTQRNTPIQVLGVGGVGYLEGVSQISTGYRHTCATKTDGTVYCWGLNSSGQLGDNTITKRPIPIQVLGVGGIGYLSGVSHISVGSYHNCSLKTDGTVYCWGSFRDGQIGSDISYNRIPTKEVKKYIPSSGYLTNISQISTGYQHTCATKIDGTAYCWGDNNSGQLGDNTIVGRFTPVQVLGVEGVGNLSGVSHISAGNYQHTCALKTDGTTYCWGSNSSGQLS